MRGDANRAGEIGADLERRHAGSQRCRRAAARSARCALDIPRIVGAAEDGIAGLVVGQQHGHIGLPDEDAAGGSEARSNSAVFLRYIIGQRRKSDGGAHAGGQVRILQREGHAMEWSPDFAVFESGIRLVRPCSSPFYIGNNDSVQCGIMLFDLR